MPKTNTRQEHDTIGTMDIPADCLWGIHTARALHNFTLSNRKVPYSLIAAIATCKRAAAMVNHELGFLDETTAKAIISACDAIAEDRAGMEEHFPLDALQGGAGTSTHMNVNEVVANLALKALKKSYGNYKTVHPLHHVNLHQSTNDVYPTAVKIAAIDGVRGLAETLATLQGVLQDKEKEFQSIVKIGRSQTQNAVPMTMGQEFSAFAEAIGRDRWRSFKCEERLRVVNIGGTAIGTGLTAPRDYIFRVIEVLRKLTGQGLSRSENVVDGTANADAFVEVSGIMKAAASNFSKIAHDLRLLHFLGEINLPRMQAGSSIMPGKVNPVILEGVIQVSRVVRANDAILADCAAHGTLQINEFMPQIAACLLESIELLSASAQSLTEHVKGITANPDTCRRYVDENPIVMTALLPKLSYEGVDALIKEYNAQKEKGDAVTVTAFLEEKFGAEEVAQILSPENVVKLGYTMERE